MLNKLWKFVKRLVRQGLGFLLDSVSINKINKSSKRKEYVYTSCTFKVTSWSSYVQCKYAEDVTKCKLRLIILQCFVFRI
jgi:hypothetical protein